MRLVAAAAVFGGRPCDKMVECKRVLEERRGAVGRGDNGARWAIVPFGE